MKNNISLIALLLAAVVAGPAVASTVLGQTALNDAKVDGALVPAGTTVLSPSKVQTGKYPAVVHLATGQTLNLGPNSSARLAAVPEGRISLAAETGAVELGTETGEVFKLAANTVAMLDQHEPGSGDAVVMIEVCDADDNLIEWDAADIDNCVDCYLPDDGECKGKPTGALGVGGGGGLSTGAAVGIALGATAVGFVVGDNNAGTTTVACGVPDASGNIPPGTNPPGVGGCP